MPDATIDTLPDGFASLGLLLVGMLERFEDEWWAARIQAFETVAPEGEIEELATPSFESEILSLARQRWPLSHAERLVRAVFSWDMDWQIDMLQTLTPVVTGGRQIGIEYVLGRLGYQLPRGYSMRSELVDGIRAHVRAVVSKMVRTQHGWLTRSIETVKRGWISDYGSLSGLNRYNIASRLTKLETARENWHMPQTGWTEAAWAFNRGIRDFLDANDPNCRVLVLPSDASDPERDHPPPCEEFAGFWFSYGSIPEFPIHPDCVHYPGEFIFSRSLQVGGFLDIGADGLYTLGALEPV